MKEEIVVRLAIPEDANRIDEVTFQGFKKSQAALQGGLARSNSYVCALKGSAMMRQSEAITLVAERHVVSNREKLKGKIKSTLHSKLKLKDGIPLVNTRQTFKSTQTSVSDKKQPQHSLTRRALVSSAEKSTASAFASAEKRAPVPSLTRGAPISGVDKTPLVTSLARGSPVAPDVSQRQKLASRIRSKLQGVKDGDEDEEIRDMQDAVVDADVWLSNQLAEGCSDEEDFWGSGESDSKMSTNLDEDDEEDEDEMQTTLPPQAAPDRLFQSGQDILGSRPQGIICAEIVGCLTVATFRSPWALMCEAGEAELRMLAVTARGKIASKLVKAAIRLCEIEGRRRVHVLVAKEAKTAQAFYEELNFYRNPTKDDGGRTDLLAYSLDLNVSESSKQALIEEDLKHFQSNQNCKHVRWGQVSTASRVSSDKYSTDRLSSASTRYTSGEIDLVGL